MNTNINNQESKILNTIISNIPESEFYSSILTRANILNIYEKYYYMKKDLPVSNNAFIRAILIKLLRFINMSIQQLDVLLI